MIKVVGVQGAQALAAQKGTGPLTETGHHHF